ncbi:MAG TPA: hypothetical protein VL422_11685 [Miltoncostaea sp.]|nr:hypothetical protein [Miltoncostaea sp.]
MPDAKGSITVTLDGTTVPYDPTAKEGWTWGDKNNGEIILAGQACSTATANATGLVASVKCGK